MASRRLAFNMNSYMASKLAAAAHFTMKYSIYPSSVSVTEMTSAQALMISLFHSFLYEDIDVIQNLLSMSQFVPQLKSSFIAVWLRDDFNFRRKDVAKVLSGVAKFIQDKGPVIPDSILFAISGLEEKYDIFEFFQQNGDEFGQQLLAYVNPLVSRSTQVESHLLQESEEKWKCKIPSTDLRKTNKQNIMPSLQIDELDLAKCPPIRPPRRNGLRRSGTLPPSSKFRHNHAEGNKSEEAQENVISAPSTSKQSVPEYLTFVNDAIWASQLPPARGSGHFDTLREGLITGVSRYFKNRNSSRNQFPPPQIYKTGKNGESVKLV